MEIVDSFPYAVREIENIWIPVTDGIRLAAKLWLPEGAEANPAPAILEYIPYRKRDFKRTRDASVHRYFAGHGYACLRVDIRGSGDSDGVLTDEYLESELADGEEILRWIASQPWCDGGVGMIGISWGGFNGLQIAARRPPELKAVITACSTDDRYADDVHYMGGCLLGDNLSWSAVMFAYNSLPPDPLIVGDAWREMWFERLKESGLWLDNWLRHQHRDGFWKHGSICEDFSSIQVPVMAVSGWADGYSNAVLRLLEHLEVPRQGLIGPWSHRYPHLGMPGPAIGFLQEALRWWDQWLKGKETGIMEEPMLRAYMHDSVPPTTSYEHRPGRWVGEPSWPSPNIEMRSYTLGWTHIVPGYGESPEVPQTVRSPLTLGLFGGKWCSYSGAPDLPHDQREDDGGAMVFESEPLAETMEILGRPEVEIELSADRPVAQVAVRLSDVAPDDKATRVTYGILNLTHRDSHESPTPLEPDKTYRVLVELNDIAQQFPAGHRFRVSISTSYWPIAWPAPRPVCLTIVTGASLIRMPVRTSHAGDRGLSSFLKPEGAVEPAVRQIKTPQHNWLVHRDLANDVATLEVVNDNGIIGLEDIELEIENDTREWYSSRADDFTSLRGEVRSVRGLKRGDWHVRTITRTILTSDPDNFRLCAELDAYENGYRVFCRSWDRRIPRRLV